MIRKWRPEPRTRNGTIVAIQDIRSIECPKSLLTRKRDGRRAVELVNVFNRTRLAKEAGGAALYGTDLSRWPPWAVDLVSMLEAERIAFDNAMLDAERSEK